MRIVTELINIDLIRLALHILAQYQSFGRKILHLKKSMEMLEPSHVTEPCNGVRELWKSSIVERAQLIKT